MSSFWSSVSSAFGRDLDPESSDSEDSYLPPSPSGKRKVGEPRRSSQPARRVSRKEAQQPTASSSGRLSSASRNDTSTVPGGRPTVAGEHETTELDIQSQLLTESQDEFDSDLSEGEWGRKYFAPAPWATDQRHSEPVGGDESEENDARLEPTPEYAETPQPKLVSFSGSDNKSKPLKLKKAAKATPRKPATKKATPTNPVEPISQPAAEPPEYMKQWATAPSQRLRTLKRNALENGKLCMRWVQQELQEPLYTIRDVEVRDKMWQIQDRMEEVAAFFQGTLPAAWEEDKLKPLARVYTNPDDSTSRILNSVAGPEYADEEEWHDILYEEDKRCALACGIMGNVLVEQVFKHPFFGGDKRTIDTLFHIQRSLRDEDAFVRKHASARRLQGPLFGKPLPERDVLRPPWNFAEHVDAVVTALDTHLRPLLLHTYAFKSLPADQRDKMLLLLVEHLTRLVGTAGLLSLHMAADPFTVYYHTPVAKGDRFEHAAHVALNEAEMQRTHPRSAGTHFSSAAERERARRHEAIVGMVLMDGLTAYRKGGWEAPGSHLYYDGKRFEGRVYAKEGYSEMGYRGRLLVHGWVFCKWGRVRQFVGGRGGE